MFSLNLKRFAVLFAFVLSMVLLNGEVSGLTIPKESVKKYSANKIYFYSPCKNGPNSNSSPVNSSCSGTLEGKNDEERIWNALVMANIDGVSNNPAAIAGIMGNLQQETEFNPFNVTGQWYGIFQTWDYNIKPVIEQAGLSQYWGAENAPDDARKQAIDLEVDWMIRNYDRFLGSGDWKGKGFLDWIDKVSEQTPEAYSDLFLVAAEDAYTNDAMSPHMSGVSNEIKEKAARDLSASIHKYTRYYQEAGKRREYARQLYDKYSSTGVCYGGVPSFNGKEVTWQELNPLSANDRLALLVETYGPYMMQLQKYYGVPWEMPFAVMVYESQVGADASSVSHLVQEAGYYNMMGLTDPVGSFEDKYRVKNVGDNGCFRNETYRECHVAYESISKMLLGYVIFHGRSGFSPNTSYDAGLKALKLDDYNLSEAIMRLMDTYCEGGCYREEIIGMIRPGGNPRGWTGVLDVIKKNNWKNSEELAKSWGINPGGIATQKWGWGDIRKQIWEAYGEAGLPANESSGAVPVESTSTNNGNGNDSGASTNTDASVVGNAVLHKPANEWLEKAGLQGYTKDPVPPGGANGAHIDSSASNGSNYTDFASDAGAGSGLPGFIVLHLTSASNFDARSWTNYCGPEMGLGFYCPPHFTIDVKKKEVFQHFPLTHPSAAVSSRGSMSADKYGIQIEVVGHGGDPGSSNDDAYSTCMAGSCTSEYNYRNFTDDDYQYLVSLLKAISVETGIPLRSTVTWAKDAREAEGLKIQSDDELKKYIGVLGHTHINGKWDPLDLWEYVSKALGNSDYVYSTAEVSNSMDCGGGFSSGSGGSYSGGGGGIPVSGHCFGISEDDGGCTEDGFTWFGQGGASWGGIDYGGCGEGGTIKDAGCGPSAMAMIITALTGKLVTPDLTAKDAVEVGARVCNGGTNSNTLASGVAPRYGLRGEHVDESQVTVQNVNKWLDEGKMMIFSVGNEYSTEYGPIGSSNGHVVAIRGKTNDGRWYLFDSARRNEARCDRHYKPEEIINAFKAHGNNNFNLVYK